MVAEGLWYGQTYFMDKEHRCTFIEDILNAYWYRDENLLPVVPYIQELPPMQTNIFLDVSLQIVFFKAIFKINHWLNVVLLLFYDAA